MHMFPPYPNFIHFEKLFLDNRSKEYALYVCIYINTTYDIITYINIYIYTYIHIDINIYIYIRLKNIYRYYIFMYVYLYNIYIYLHIYILYM